MYQSLELFQTAGAMARHAGARQAIVTRNIANADTPAYRAEQTAAFRDAYQASPASDMRQTRAGHMGQGPSFRPTLTSLPQTSEPSPNGNSVSLEDELLASVSVAREHSRALAIYRHGLTVLRTSLGRG